MQLRRHSRQAGSSDGASDRVRQAVADFVRRSTTAPADLEPSDLALLEREVGRPGALEIAAVVCCFHAITRIADLIGIKSWLEPALGHQRFRRAWLPVQSFVLRCALDFSPPSEQIDGDDELRRIGRLLGGPPPPSWVSMLRAPSFAASVRSLLSGLATVDADVRQRVEPAVARALPPRAAPPHDDPGGPLEALAAAATRRARCVPRHLIETVRQSEGWDDGQLSEGFYAIGVANALERCGRLLGGSTIRLAEQRIYPVREKARIGAEVPPQPPTWRRI